MEAEAIRPRWRWSCWRTRRDLTPERENEEWPRVDAIPFASERRYMATLNRDPEGKHIIHVKGAPERVLEMCASELRGDEIVDLDAERWRERVP
ncbi:MAG: hypothetical protein U5K56_00130 [Halioglobus sp.]|nr:hypothetical protein [Halioglobus sp.]